MLWLIDLVTELVGATTNYDGTPWPDFPGVSGARTNYDGTPWPVFPK